MPKIKFGKDCRIAELPQHGGRIIDGKKGGVEEVSHELAEVIVDSNLGERITVAKVEVPVKDEMPAKAPKVPENSGDKNNPSVTDKFKSALGGN